MLLTDEILLDYQRCRRRSFLNVYGDRDLLDPDSDFLLKIQKDSRAYRQSVLAGQTLQVPAYRYGDFDAGAKATLDLMRQGVDRIYRGVLLAEDSSGVTLVSCPDLLVKQAGESAFGDWLYFPIDIKFSKRPKRESNIIAAFHAQVLAVVQEAWPDKSWLILREKGEYQVNLAKFLPQMQEVLDNCIEMLQERSEPEVFISRHPCDMCEWFSSCYEIAHSNSHLSLLPGVTAARYRQLQEINIRTVEALAAADPATLASVLEEACNNQFEPEQVADQLVLQAQASHENRAIAKPGQVVISPRELPTSPVELYFDIEAYQEIDLFFLLGVLVVERKDANPGLPPQQKFYPFLAERPEDEGAIWEQFLDLVWTYPIAPIFHFCDYEVQTVKLLAKRYNTPRHRWQPLLKRFADIHERVTRSAVLPVESYALKAIARWLGFQWRDRQANGAQCVFWYSQWLKTLDLPEGERADHTYLDLILEYNEDDCRATYLLKDWLVSFLEKE